MLPERIKKGTCDLYVLNLLFIQYINFIHQWQAVHHCKHFNHFQLWITRINIAAREHHVPYSVFMNQLTKVKINLVLYLLLPSLFVKKS